MSEKTWDPSGKFDLRCDTGSSNDLANRASEAKLEPEPQVEPKFRVGQEVRITYREPDDYDGVDGRPLWSDHHWDCLGKFGVVYEQVGEDAFRVREMKEVRTRIWLARDLKAAKESDFTQKRPLRQRANSKSVSTLFRL